MSLHLITRCEFRSIYGYRFRLKRNWRGRVIDERKDFHVGTCGGWLAARNAAIEHRDRILERYGMPLRQTSPVYIRAMRDSSTGRLGVSLRRLVQRGRWPGVFAVAQLRTGGTASFSVKKYGKARALDLAVQARRKSERDFATKQTKR